MTKLDKYHIFDRECPFKEEWNNEKDKEKYKEYNIDRFNNLKKGLNEKSHSKK